LRHYGRMATALNNRALEEARWRAVRNRDAAFDGAFVFAVVTNGVYCRPSCPSRRANRENVSFFDVPALAEALGYRPCKRCRPNEAAGRQPHVEAVNGACDAIAGNETEPSLSALAEAAGLSPGHFQRVFKSVVGLSPKQFAKAVRANKFRDRLAGGASVTNAVFEAGYGSASRAYDDAARNAMSPSARKAGGAGEKISWAAAETSLGRIVVAARPRGICFVEFADGRNPENCISGWFPAAAIKRDEENLSDHLACVVAAIDDPGAAAGLPLDLRGTAFQERVWRALTDIPAGKTVTYSELARTLGKPAAARAVASAIGKNKITVLVPCHRVIREDGSLAGYRWGVDRKAALIDREKGE